MKAVGKKPLYAALLGCNPNWKPEYKSRQGKPDANQLAFHIVQQATGQVGRRVEKKRIQLLVKLQAPDERSRKEGAVF